MAPAGLPARPRHRRDQGEEPPGRRLHPRRPRHHRLGRHQRGGRGHSLWIIDTAAAYIAEHSRPEPFGPRPRRVRRPAARSSDVPVPRRCTHDPRPRLRRPADGRALHRHRRGAGLPRRRRAPPPGRARHLLPRPLPAHQGQAAGPRPAAHRHRRGVRRAARGARRRLPRGLPGLLRPQRHPGQPRDPRQGPAGRAGARRRDVQLRQGQADRPRGRGVLRQRHQRDARRRGTLDLRPDRRGGEVPHRVLGAGGGQAPADARAEAAGHPGRAGHRGRLRHRSRDRREAGRRGRLRRDRRPVAGEGAGGRRRDRVDRRGRRGPGRRQRRRGRAGRRRRGGPRLRRGGPGRQQRRSVALAARCWRPPRPTGTFSTT